MERHVFVMALPACHTVLSPITPHNEDTAKARLARAEKNELQPLP